VTLGAVPSRPKTGKTVVEEGAFTVEFTHAMLGKPWSFPALHLLFDLFFSELT
jgi:hypothetical protein